MAENRYHELLGIPEEVADPDYYQLLGIDRAQTDPRVVEECFKKQMTRAQHIENPRHKEFLEFLKGELKRARGILADPARRREYDKELIEERGDELRKVLSHMLVDGKLSSMAEVSLITEGRNLGLEGGVIRRIIDEELNKAGAKRVSVSSGIGGDTQIIVNKKAQEAIRQAQDARVEARVAHARAHIAEIHQKKAENQALAVLEKARQVQALVRKAITREQVATAKEQMSEQERRQLEERVVEGEARVQRLVDEANAEFASIRSQGIRWPRLALSYACLFIAYLAGDALASVAPGVASDLARKLGALLSRVSATAGGLIPVVGLAILVGPLHLLAGRRRPFFIAPLVLMVALALAASLLGR